MYAKDLVIQSLVMELVVHVAWAEETTVRQKEEQIRNAQLPGNHRCEGHSPVKKRTNTGVERKRKKKWKKERRQYV